MIWDKEKIKTVLPHREPFLFIEEIIEIDGTRKIVASKRIKENEDFFRGHFPGNPIMPGVLIIEAMAQASVILFTLDRPQIAETQPDYYLGKVKAELLAPVYPGDHLILESNKVKCLDFALITDNMAKVKDKVVAKANLVFSIQQK
jgi:3-hydroxyacyl-[acyl-carrier-protein] dehydratase